MIISEQGLLQSELVTPLAMFTPSASEKFTLFKLVTFLIGSFAQIEFKPYLLEGANKNKFCRIHKDKINFAPNTQYQMIIQCHMQNVMLEQSS